MADVKLTISLESFKDEIRQAFMAYVTHATAVLARQQDSKKTPVNAPVKLVHQDSSYTLRSLVAQAEDSFQFKHLLSALDFPIKTRDPEPAQNLDKTTYQDPTDSLEKMTEDDLRELGNYISYLNITHNLSNFFRRSCFYLNAFNGTKQSLDELFGILWSRLLGVNHAKTTNLSILDEVAFASPCLDFGTFKIQRFSKTELDDLTGQVINKIFYPLSQLDDTDFLSRYWFLVEDPRTWAVESMAGVDDEDEWDKVEQWRRIKLQMPQPSIQLLALYNWQREFTDDALAELRATGEEYRESLGWTGFPIRKTFTVSTDLFASPSPLPNVTSDSGLLAGFDITFNQQQESEIKAIVAKGQRLLEVVQTVPRWNFVENAMGYLGKAFSAAPNLEQLLWNTIAIECLLSEKKDVKEFAKSMRQRIGIILGVTGEERKKIKDAFDDVYLFRCELVHGSDFAMKKTQFSHLAQARDLARRVMSWFIDWLLHLDSFQKRSGKGHEDYPSREGILSYIDKNEMVINQFNYERRGQQNNFPHL